MRKIPSSASVGALAAAVLVLARGRSGGFAAPATDSHCRTAPPRGVFVSGDGRGGQGASDA